MSQKRCEICHRPKLIEPSILSVMEKAADRRSLLALGEGVPSRSKAIGRSKRLQPFASNRLGPTRRFTGRAKSGALVSLVAGGTIRSKETAQQLPVRACLHWAVFLPHRWRYDHE